MADNLSGKVAVITGGAVRVGRAITLALAAAGCDVFIHYGRSVAEASEVQSAALGHGVRAEVYAADLRDPAAAAGVIPAAVDLLGRVDFLVNNAAIFLSGNLLETRMETWENQFAINLRAPFLLCQAFARYLPEGRHGAIVNITDARIFRPGQDHFAYRLTKAALATMTENLALDLAPRIRVNALALGAILPPPDEDGAYLQQVAENQVPLCRPGSAELVAENVLHLLRQEFLTGVILKLDGGQFL